MSSEPEVCITVPESLSTYPNVERGTGTIRADV